jgi:hypothetical protein
MKYIALTIMTVALVVAAGCDEDPTQAKQIQEVANLEKPSNNETPSTKETETKVNNLAGDKTNELTKVADDAKAKADEMVGKAKELLEQTMAMIKEGKLDSASDLMDKLLEMKSSLPLSLQTKIDEIATSMAKAKTTLGGGDANKIKDVTDSLPKLPGLEK